MLSGEEIIKEIENGNIIIEPFNKDRVNPNSYNMTLGDTLLVYTEDILDCKKENKTREIKITKEGYILSPGTLYLAKTSEYTDNPMYVPQISGRSSIGRVGLTAHISAGFGGIGFKGSWTLGITCVRPVKVYPGMEICQIYFYPLKGNDNIKYNGRYMNEGQVIASRVHKDFQEQAN